LAKSYRAGAAAVDVIEAAERDLAQQAIEYLEETATRLREEGLTVQVATRYGNPPKAIIEVSQRERVDLLVMCTRGQTGPARWLLGSVVDRVIRGSSVPVVVIPARTGEPLSLGD
jgi:nucleotide-binding universal stress UspA family protein